MLYCHLYLFYPLEEVQKKLELVHVCVDPMDPTSERLWYPETLWREGDAFVNLRGMDGHQMCPCKRCSHTIGSRRQGHENGSRIGCGVLELQGE